MPIGLPSDSPRLWPFGELDEDGAHPGARWTPVGWRPASRRLRSRGPRPHRGLERRSLLRESPRRLSGRRALALRGEDEQSSTRRRPAVGPVDRRTPAALTAPERRGARRGFQRALAEDDRVVGGVRLQSDRDRDDRFSCRRGRLTTASPFVDLTGVCGGYDLLQADGLDAGLAVAARTPRGVVHPLDDAVAHG